MVGIGISEKLCGESCVRGFGEEEGVLFFFVFGNFCLKKLCAHI